MTHTGLIRENNHEFNEYGTEREQNRAKYNKILWWEWNASMDRMASEQAHQSLNKNINEIVSSHDLQYNRTRIIYVLYTVCTLTYNLWPFRLEWVWSVFCFVIEQLAKCSCVCDGNRYSNSTFVKIVVYIQHACVVRSFIMLWSVCRIKRLLLLLAIFTPRLPKCFWDISAARKIVVAIARSILVRRWKWLFDGEKENRPNRPEMRDGMNDRRKKMKTTEFVA